jgi:hypothetical protein
MPAATEEAAVTRSGSCVSSAAAAAGPGASPAKTCAGCSRPASTAARAERKRHSISRVDNVRALEPLWHLRQRRHAVIACLDDTRQLEALRPELEELRAELVLERTAGPLSAALGRPSVTVASRFGRIGWRGTSLSRGDVLEALEAFELSCPECGPVAWGDPGG